MDIYCIGRNYVEHAKELGNEVPTTPLVFLSTEGSLRSLQDGPVAFENEEFAYEAEFVVRVGKDHMINEQYSDESLDALTLGIDLTRRDNQTIMKDKGHPWTTAKSFLGSKLLGDFIVGVDLSKHLEFEFYLEGQLKQIGKTELMIFSIPQIVNYLNSFSPLKKGDLIYTGTPQGVGAIKKGEKFDLKINSLNFHQSGKL